MRLSFEWDEAKAKINLTKHGVPFHEALPVFLDPNRIERYDGREDYGEDRYVVIGSVDGFELCIA